MEKPLIFLYVVAIVCGMLIIGWIWFFEVVRRNKESVRELLTGTSFLQNLTVIAVVLTTGLLSVTGILKGELAATLLSGIVGYVLGTTRSHTKSNNREIE